MFNKAIVIIFELSLEKIWNLWKLVKTCENLWKLVKTCENLWKLVKNVINMLKTHLNIEKHTKMHSVTDWQTDQPTNQQSDL